ncbi:DNA-directed RNA polymerase subunit alpha [bacterium]|jgi:DNA-directed RNA polymerase subunit alpha|nr:MAG: DNA-directed RNA polymerase subunit alpha [bacterium]
MLNTNIGNPPRVQAAPGATDRYAKFTVQPLPKGYGHTLGASLRRVLLSSIEGVAITAVQVQGVQHEFSTMPGIVEDMMEIVLNLKEIGIKSTNGRLEGPVAARIDKVGEGRVTGADVQLPPGVQIISPEKPICTLSKSEARFDAVLTIEGGVGYVPSGMQERSKTIGTIPVDAIYSPVTRVNYFVEPTRSGQQTDLDKLVIEIFTNGALSPGAALSSAGAILTQYLGLFIGLDGEVEIMPLDGAAPAQNRARDIKIDDLDFSNRTYNCLKRQGIETLEELGGYTEEELMNIRNFGQKSLDEVKDKLKEYNLELRPPASSDSEEYNI